MKYSISIEMTSRDLSKIFFYFSFLNLFILKDKHII